ncbi:ABC transporter ATP-binding protein [bacterium]|nr:MAG: ABC transporter ATP-binding protein [bacterium]
MDKTQFKLFLKFFKYLLPYRKRQFAILILSCLSVFLGLVNPYLSKLIVDKAILNKELRPFIALGLLGTVVFIFNGLLAAVEDFLKRGLRLKVTFDLNKKVFGHLQGFSLGLFRDKSTGEHIFKMHYDIERAADFIVCVPEECIHIFPRLLFILAIIFFLDWQMALLAMFLAPALYLPVYYLTSRMRRILEEFVAQSQDIFRMLEEAFSHIYLIKAFAKEKAQMRAYLRALIRKTRVGLKNIRLEIIGSFAMVSFERVIIGLIAFFGGYQIIRGRISPGSLTAIMIYLSQLINLQSRFAFFLQRASLGMVSCRRLDKILEEMPGPGEITGAKKIALKGSGIQFRKVSFGYRPQEYIFKDMDLNIEKGFIALVGPSGCGKTTILNLVLRLEQPWRGGIFIDGYNTAGLDASSLRNQIGIALQNPFLWNDTVENNIKYARAKAGDEEIAQAASITAVDDFVRDLPCGYKTIIGESGCKLSEGQKQRIALARALIKRPKILLLDEAMSSLDSASEEGIVRELRKLPINIVIAVSHRLSTVMACDLVYFLKSPQKVIVNSPQRLLEEDRDFYDLFAGQIKDSILAD